MEELDKTFTTPIVITYLSSQMDADTMAGIQQKAVQSGGQMDLSEVRGQIEESAFPPWETVFCTLLPLPLQKRSTKRLARI